MGRSMGTKVKGGRLFEGKVVNVVFWATAPEDTRGIQRASVRPYICLYARLSPPGSSETGGGLPEAG